MEEWQEYLWKLAEGPHPKDQEFSGAHVPPPPPLDETQGAGKRGEQVGAARYKHDHAQGAPTNQAQLA